MLNILHSENLLTHNLFSNDDTFTVWCHNLYELFICLIFEILKNIEQSFDIFKYVQ